MSLPDLMKYFLLILICLLIGAYVGVQYTRQTQENQYMKGFHDGLDFAVKATQP